MVLGVGAGIGFGFGGVTCGGGVAELEERGLLVLAAFWSFASRFSRIYPSLVNTFHEIWRVFIYPVSIVLGGWTQLVRIRIGAHGGRRDYRCGLKVRLGGYKGAYSPNRKTRRRLDTVTNNPFRSLMFFSSTSATSLLNAVAGFRSGSRSFATSSALWYPKLKSHSGAKKRWRGLPNGLFKRVSFGL